VLVALSACSASNESGGDGGDGLSGELNGAGSSAQEAAMTGWRSGFQTENPGVTVNYDPVGSGGGREQFIAGGKVSFAGSDAYLEGKELAAAQKRCGGAVVEIPAYISPIAVVFNLPGVDSVNLSPQTIGAIFAGDITRWDDPAITADNADVDLPDTAITPVHRSDESGTTENFTSYLEAASGGSWSHGTVETWPITGGEGADGTSGVVQAVTAGEGYIGYADASQAGDLGVAAVGVGDEFVEYSPEAAAAVVDASQPVQGRSDTDLAIDVARDTSESGVYPIVLVSYHIACTEYDNAKQGELVKAFLTYAVSEDGQAAAADAAGSAPISADMREKALSAIEAIH
jgi:phosphate transport system substrate-binding protein